MYVIDVCVCVCVIDIRAPKGTTSSIVFAIYILDGMR